MKLIKPLIILILLGLLSCKPQLKFDRSKWTTKEYPEAPPEQRDRMLKDLMTNYKLVGLSRTKVLELLGFPDGTNDSMFIYEISVDYGTDIDPVAGKYFDLFFNADSVVNSIKISEWKK